MPLSSYSPSSSPSSLPTTTTTTVDPKPAGSESPETTSPAPPSRSSSPSSCSSYSESEHLTASNTKNNSFVVCPPSPHRSTTTTTSTAPRQKDPAFPHHYKFPQHPRDAPDSLVQLPFPRPGDANPSRLARAHSLQSSPERLARSSSIHKSSPSRHLRHHSKSAALGPDLLLPSSSLLPALRSSPTKSVASSAASASPSRQSTTNTIPPFAFPLPANRAQPAPPAAPMAHNPPAPPPSSDGSRSAGPSSSSSSRPDLDTVQALLGPEITSWNFSDESLKAALELRTEQEKTRQELYKLELRKKTSELLSEAVRYNVPPSLIPILFNAPPLENVPEGVQAPPEYAQQHSPPYTYPPYPSSSSPVRKPPVKYTHSFPSSSKNQPVDALGLGSSSTTTMDRERFPSHAHHQRNMSLPQLGPQGPTFVPSEYQLRQPGMNSQALQQQQQHPTPQKQPGAFRPGHHQPHHASMSAIPPSHYSGPSQQGVINSIYQPSSRSSWQSSSGAGAYGPAQTVHPPNPGSPSTSMHHIIQFHHWQPNQQKPAAAVSPKKDAAALSDDSSSIKRRRSMTAERLDRSGSPAAVHKSSPSSTAVASASARRRSMHSRHRSETLVLRGDLSKMTLYSNPPTSSTSSSSSARAPPASAALQAEAARERTGSPGAAEPQGGSGFSYLASVAAEESRKLKDAAGEGKHSPQYTHEPASSKSSLPVPASQTPKMKLSPDFKYPATSVSAETDSADATAAAAESEEATTRAGEDVAMLDVPHHESQRSHKQGVQFMISDPASTSPASPH